MSSAAPVKLSASAYARWRHVSHAAVLKAIDAGRLVRSVERPAPRKILIDRDLADLEWSGATDPAQQREEGVQTSGPETQRELFADDRRVPTPADADRERSTFQRARGMREVFRAKISELEYRQRAGDLVDRKDYIAAAFETGRLLKSRLGPIGRRIGPRLAALADGNACAELVDQEIAAALREVARAIEELDP